MNYYLGWNTHKEDEVEEEQEVLGHCYAAFSHGAGAAKMEHKSHKHTFTWRDSSSEQVLSCGGDELDANERWQML